MPKVACGKHVNAWWHKWWIDWVHSSTAWLTIDRLVGSIVSNYQVLPKVVNNLSGSYPHAIRPHLPLIEYTFYPVSTAPTIIPTRKERIE